MLGRAAWHMGTAHACVHLTMYGKRSMPLRAICVGRSETWIQLPIALHSHITICLLIVIVKNAVIRELDGARYHASPAALAISLLTISGNNISLLIQRCRAQE
jgi:hypothetical protein